MARKIPSSKETEAGGNCGKGSCSIALISSSNTRICLHLKLGIIRMRRKVLMPLYLSLGMGQNPIILGNKGRAPFGKGIIFY